MLTNLMNGSGKFYQIFVELFDAYIYSENNETLEISFTNRDHDIFLKELCNENRELLFIFRKLMSEAHFHQIEIILSNKISQISEFNLKFNEIVFNYEIFFIFLETNKILLFFRDISNKYQISEEKENTILKNLLDFIPYPIELKAPDGYFISSNKAHKDMWGARPDTTFNILEDPQVLDVEKVLFRRASQGEIIKVGESYYNPHLLNEKYPDKYHWQNIVLFPIFDSKGKVVSVACMEEDITERKEAQLKVEELKQQLEERVKERTIKLENSEKKYRKAYKRANCFKGLFNHDISNIINRISNSLEISHSLLTEDKSRQLLLNNFDIIQQQLNRGKRLVNNIRDLSEIEESEMPIVPIDVFKNLNDAIDYLKTHFAKKDIQVEINSYDDKITVLANELLLDVFENILINGVDYNKNPIIKIEIDITERKVNEANFVKFEFKDNGIGITDERKEIIFKEGKNQNEFSKGLGLGLSLVSKFLELCEGKVWVENKCPGDHTKGSNFVILIKKA